MSSLFSGKNRETPSATGLGDTNLSDGTVKKYIQHIL